MYSGNDIQANSLQKRFLNNSTGSYMETFPKKCREYGGQAAVPRGNKPAEWPQAGNGTEA
jgi:hypothetical protein